MYNPNTIPYCNRKTTREVERYQKKHPNLTFTECYNKIYNTKYNEPGVFDIDTTGERTSKDHIGHGPPTNDPCQRNGIWSFGRIENK